MALEGLPFLFPLLVLSAVSPRSPPDTLAGPLVLCFFVLLLQPPPSVLRGPGGAVSLLTYSFCLECRSPQSRAEQTLIRLSGLTEVTSFLELSHRCSISSSSSHAVKFTVDYPLVWGVVYILNLRNTLLETLVYICPLLLDCNLLKCGGRFLRPCCRRAGCLVSAGWWVFTAISWEEKRPPPSKRKQLP